MYKTYRQFLFTVVCVAIVGCIPQSTSVDVLPPTSITSVELQESQNHQKQAEECQIAILEKKQRILLLKQDYQGALNLMLQLEEELFKKSMLAEECPYETLRIIRDTYCYLYLALGKDEEALQKILEIDLPVDPDPMSAFADWRTKTLIMERLNMFDEVIDEYKALVGQSPTSHEFYPDVLLGLTILHIFQGDFESAQDTIDRYKDYLQSLPMPVRRILQYDPMYTEYLSSMEYYINNLTETYVVRLVKGYLEPPTRDPDNPNLLILTIPGNGYEFVSKTDGTILTLDDIRKILAERLLYDPFPILDSFSSPPTELQ